MFVTDMRNQWDNEIKTPIHYLGDFQENNIYIKRDDLIPFSFGGNKARKAIGYFQEIDSGNYDCVVTYGSSSSNHCRIVSNMAALRKMPCYIISPKEVSKPTFNSRMMVLYGAEITTVPVKEVHDTIDAKIRKLRGQSKTPYFIEGGGHGNFGTKAYVNCYEEIKQYEEENKVYFNYIFLASGTGTTQAGLVCGQLIHGDERKIIGISIARKNPRGRAVVQDSIVAYLKSEGYKSSENRIETATIFDDSYTSNGYGKDSTEIENTIKEVLLNYGIPLDSTYTGKAYTGMREYIKAHKVKKENILFIHTGGTPLFFDDLENMR